MNPSRIIASVSLICLTLPATAQSPAPNYFVANCFNCHGTEGRGHSAIPPLAGLSTTYFVEQMNAFKAGTRQASLMHQLSKGYTDGEIAIAAAYFAAQKK
jgi:sulfide dehydrogenase cytochrome subunit